MSTVVRAAIHPAIGVARVGDSQEEFFIGPEVVEPDSEAPGFYKDDTGALKRQAARFRIYGYDADGNVVRELTAEEADVNLEWTAHLANQKAAWYDFEIALDIPEAQTEYEKAHAQGKKFVPRRNADIAGTDRDGLVIDPGPRTIAGMNTQGPDYHFDGGTFMGTEVPLGELRTDAAGRLLVLGGHGFSSSYKDQKATTFGNNDTWHDDVGDGPVTATVSIDGQSIPVDPAWVVVAPPNYAPDLKTVRTLYDVIFDTHVQSGVLPFPDTVSFTEHILPILERSSELQWVNKGFAQQFGHDRPYNFQDPDLLTRLGQKPSSGDPYREFRRQVFHAFRPTDPKDQSMSRTPWPWMYGDAMSLPPTSVRQWTALTGTQHRMMEMWVKGDVTFDYDPDAAAPHTLEAVPESDRPAMLDKAALEFCLGEAFHPGCEMTWPMRHATMYQGPFRLKHRPADASPPDYGDELSPAEATGVNGPLYAQGPGDISRWMAVPWQTDTASCRAGYEKDYDPYLPTFWPARVPNHVLTETDYETVRNLDASETDRVEAFNHRAVWYRGLGDGDYESQINNMVTEFGKLGVVERREGVSDNPDFPQVMYVESVPSFEHDAPARRNLVLVHVEAKSDAALQKAAAAAIAASEHPDEEVVAGRIDKVVPPHRRKR